MRRSIYVAGVVACVISVLAISGCSSELSGTYEVVGGMMKLEFKPGAKVKFTAGGESRELSYTRSGDKITIQDSKEGNMVLTRNSDGTLTGPMGTTFTKVKA